MKKLAWSLFAFLTFYAFAFPGTGVFAEDMPTGNFYKLIQPLRRQSFQRWLESPRACFKYQREASSYGMGINDLNWDWTSDMEPDEESGREGVWAAPRVTIPSFSEISGMFGSFIIKAPAGGSVDCSRISAQARFKAKTPPAYYSDLPWQSAPVTLSTSSDSSCGFLFSIPVETVSELFNSLPDYTSSGYSHHELAVFLSAAGPSCIQWHQKFHVTFSERSDVTTHYRVSIASGWDERFGPDPVIQLVP